MTGLHFILSSVLKERESTTPQPALETFYDELNKSDMRSFVASVPATTLPKIALIDKLSMCRASLMTAN